MKYFYDTEDRSQISCVSCTPLIETKQCFNTSPVMITFSTKNTLDVTTKKRNLKSKVFILFLIHTQKYISTNRSIFYYISSCNKLIMPTDTTTLPSFTINCMTNAVTQHCTRIYYFLLLVTLCQHRELLTTTQ